MSHWHTLYEKRVTSKRMYKAIIMFYSAFRHPSCSGVISMAEILIVNVLVRVMVKVK